MTTNLASHERGHALTTRIAPTPSGFLHEGNAANALLVHWLSRANAGPGSTVGSWTVALRIDDMDTDRVRSAYVEDIFEVLAWLGIPWNAGPATMPEYQAQREGVQRDAFLARNQAMRRAALALRDGTDDGVRTFVCACSRRAVSISGRQGCANDCAARNLELSRGATSLRLRIPADMCESMDGRSFDLAREHPDAVLWRRDDLPAYHLASVLADEELGTTHVVRGEDLRSSSALHVVLARALGATRAACATYLHHGIVTDGAGRKLSKSQMNQGTPMSRTPETARRIEEYAIGLGEPLGIHPVRGDMRDVPR